MKKQLIGIVGLLLTFSIAMTGCSSSSGVAESSSSEDSNRVSSSQMASQSSEEDDNVPSSNATELTVQFGDSGDSFVMHLEDNSTAAAIAGYVGTSDWRLPVYSYDESDVMEYYDVPSRYEIPDNSETVTEAHAGDVFYPFWHDHGLVIRDSEMTELCRAALWYSDHITIENTKLHGIKALRECSDIMMRGCDMLSPEFGWSAHNIQMENCDAESEYFMMRSTNLHFNNVRMQLILWFSFLEQGKHILPEGQSALCGLAFSSFYRENQKSQKIFQSLSGLHP